ncbi:MAG TPA: lytic transglycosylase domain-containing protein [Thermoanaerobaculia bacterium]|nr:lytic transglycosylase domain-containing protein [Thermoanaerobaculia bacterium]
MQNPKARRFPLVLLLPLLAIVPILSSSPTPQPALRVTNASTAPLSNPHSPSPALYSGAAHALRQGSLQEARQKLDQIARERPAETANTLLLAGLYAQAEGKTRVADQLLSGVAQPESALEDWRLFVLAENAAERRGAEDVATARSYYARLISDFPASPLRGEAYLAAARLAVKQGEERAALDLAAQARAAGIAGEEAGELDELAWDLGRRLDDPEAQREAGRRLLIEDPLSSEAREAARAFRAADGKVDWDRLRVSADDVVRRAHAFLEGDNPEAALTTLDNLSEERRGFDWSLARAEALTRSRRGLESLAFLDTLLPSGRAERAALEWQRAQAATAAAGRSSLSASERRRMLDIADRYLSNTVQLDPGLEMSASALRGIYEDFQASGLTQPALATLRLLRRVDPEDGTGAEGLWEQGWEAYQHGRAAAAVAAWSQLESIYPGHRETHRGRYWKARALEALGRPAEAQALYRDLVTGSDTADFYSAQALARLRGDAGDPALARNPISPAAAWPEPALRRAKLMIDLGLDDLAEREMEILDGRASERDLLALKALLLCRQGEQRTGLLLLREAFPALGGPRQSTVPEEILRAYYPLEYGDTIAAAAAEVGLPPYLVAGIIRQESAFDPRATSPVGARGLMQLMPATAREMSSKVGLPYAPESLYRPEVSIRLGAAYFREVLDGFDGNVALALAGYNGGPNRIRRLREEAGPAAGLDDFLENLSLDESRNYVKRILVLSDSYRQLYPPMRPEEGGATIRAAG